jgi:hypothetical protein
LPTAVALPKNKSGYCYVRFAEKIKFLSFQELQVPAGQTVGNGIVVDFKIFHQDCRFRSHKTVTVQPGVIRDELNLYLKPHGVFLA